MGLKASKRDCPGIQLTAPWTLEMYMDEYLLMNTYNVLEEEYANAPEMSL